MSNEQLLQSSPAHDVDLRCQQWLQNIDAYGDTNELPPPLGRLELALSRENSAQHSLDESTDIGTQIGNSSDWKVHFMRNHTQPCKGLVVTIPKWSLMQVSVSARENAVSTIRAFARYFVVVGIRR